MAHICENKHIWMSRKRDFSNLILLFYVKYIDMKVNKLGNLVSVTFIWETSCMQIAGFRYQYKVLNRHISRLFSKFYCVFCNRKWLDHICLVSMFASFPGWYFNVSHHFCISVFCGDLKVYYFCLQKKDAFWIKYQNFPKKV